jgi:methionine sulfoxide reductase heme-binding subunit
MSNETISLERPQASPSLAGVLAIAFVGLCAAAYWNGGGSLEATRFIDRMTIRIGVVLFSMTFAASALRRFIPSETTRWLSSNRRNLTISFVVVFALHLCAIARFYILDENLFWSVSPVFLIVLRAVGVLFIILMLVEALIDGEIGRWKLVSAFGSYYVWGAFFAGFAKRIALSPFYVLPVVLLVSVLTLRVVDATRRK